MSSTATTAAATFSAAKYKKKDLREHILMRPDSYIGSRDTNPDGRWVFNPETSHMAWRTVHMNPGLYKLFDEVLVNARDAFIRSATECDRLPVKHIDISLTRDESGEVAIRVSNDGDGIPVELHPTEKVYAPELIFGHLLTSDNYEDEDADGNIIQEQRVTGGKNGYGAKLANIYSTRFTLEVVDPHNSKKYTQTWRNNMSVCEKASVKKCSASKGLVTIEFVPDLSRFPGGMSADMEAVFHTRAIELAALVGREVKVSWNGAVIASNTFEKFVKLFLREGQVGVAHEVCGQRWEVAAVMAHQLYSEDEGIPDEKHISFVNGINTRKGGKHVETVARAVLTDVCEAAGKRKKKMDLKPGQIKDCVVFFVAATIVNPSFDSQTKECLTTPSKDFGSRPEFSGKLTEALIKLGILDEAAAVLEAKINRDAKRSDGSKGAKIRNMPKLVDANVAGTKRSGECTLILTEGDSAATSAMSGLSVVGRDLWGVFPLRGKLLNVRDATLAKINGNEEITSIKKILGLEHGRRYEDVSQLRYGRIMIMADQDHDGSHIKGLVMNLIHAEWPGLLEAGFICSLLTPILKASKGRTVESFYSMPQFEVWKAAQPAGLRGWSLKYYKGLGTSTPQEAKDWFVRLADIRYEHNEDTNNALTLAFSKDRIPDRKEWLMAYDSALQVDAASGAVSYSDFINKELIHFSNADNIRSIPALMDGLKPSQRKILFGCFKRNLRSEIRVAQLAGYVSEHAAYHHGEASLTATIVGMAQNFVGSNNVNLLKPIGQFGSRIKGGDDAASARYIHTELMPIIDALFKKADQAILKYNDDDGQLVEPVHYLPTVPLLAFNGAAGIGTGFSTNIPSYNPAHIIALLKARLQGDMETLAGHELDPWYMGFKGRITRQDDTTWRTHGLYEFDERKHSITITELPVGTWSQTYKEFLNDLILKDEEILKGIRKTNRKAGENKSVGTTSTRGSRGKKEADASGLRDFEDHFTDNKVKFILSFSEDAYDNWKADLEAFEKKFKLVAKVKTSNMIAFSPAGTITKYDTIGDILEEFYEPRLEAYQARKDALLAALDAELEEMRAKLLFIRGVLDERIVIARRSDAEIVEQLKAVGVPPLSIREEPDNMRAYEYVLRMRIDRIKAAAVEDLEKEVAVAEAAVAELEEKTSGDLWMEDLEEFDAAWIKYSAERTAEYEVETTPVAGAGAGAPKKKSAAKKSK
jgi:DNA topoisomerase-2